MRLRRTLDAPVAPHNLSKAGRCQRDLAGIVGHLPEELVREGLARTETDVEDYAVELEALHREPARRDLAWRLGLDQEVTEPSRRVVEIRNFIEQLARLHQSVRGRA